MELGNVVPVLRVLDEAAAKEFYVEFLGFSYNWEHRFEDDLPVYVGMSRGTCQLHLTGHFGDAIPGSRVRIACSDVDALQEELRAKSYKYCRPEVQEMAWGRELAVLDPFGNRLIFFDAKNLADRATLPEKPSSASTTEDPERASLSDARDTFAEPIGLDEIAEANADFAAELNLDSETFEPK